MKTFRQPLFAVYFILIAVFYFTASAMSQYKVETFGKMNKNGANPETPADFKSSFALKAPVFIQFTFPATPADYVAECYWLDNGQEKMRGTANFKCYEKDGKTKKFHNNLGIMYESGDYKVVVLDAQKKVVAETKFTITGEVAQSSIGPKGTITFCDDTDDNLKPLKPAVNNTINKGDGINLQVKLDKGVGARFFVWAIYEISSNGDEKPWKDWQVDVANEKYTTFATSDKIYFTKPGKYAVYMLRQNGTNSGLTVGNHTDYYAKNVLTVK